MDIDQLYCLSGLSRNSWHGSHTGSWEKDDVADTAIGFDPLNFLAPKCSHFGNTGHWE